MKTKMLKSTLTAAVLSMGASGWAIAGESTYYRWLDETGTPVNSDRPPPTGIEYDVIRTRTNEAVESAAPADDVVNSAESGQDLPPQQAAQTAAAESTLDPEACSAARGNLETLNSYARIRVPDGNGSFRFLNEEEKTQQREHALAAIEHYCE
ncbi:MAG: DUF4124 domain-containing protein [Pseudomonadota bacterium]